MRSAAAEDLVAAVFYALPLNDGVKSLSSAGKSAVQAAIDKALKAAPAKEQPEGLEIEFSCDLGEVRRTLAARGFETDRTWRLDLNLVKNVSFSSAGDVTAAILKALNGKVPYFVDGEYRTSPERLTKDLDSLKISIDDLPFAVRTVNFSTEAGAVKVDVAIANP